jgi:hypothetical protein
MTERDAAADLTVCEAAAQEPWGVDHVDGSDWIANELHGVITPGIGNDGQPYLVANDTDLEFIALAREALPYWIHRAEEQRQRAERAERALERLAELDGCPYLDKSPSCSGLDCAKCRIDWAKQGREE